MINLTFANDHEQFFRQELENLKEHDWSTTSQPTAQNMTSFSSSLNSKTTIKPPMPFKLKKKEIRDFRIKLEKLLDGS